MSITKFRLLVLFLDIFFFGGFIFLLINNKTKNFMINTLGDSDSSLYFIIWGVTNNDIVSIKLANV